MINKISQIFDVHLYRNYELYIFLNSKILYLIINSKAAQNLNETGGPSGFTR